MSSYSEGTTVHVRTIADMNAAVVSNLHRIPSDVDLVVGIPRSGLLAATMVALHLNLPLTDLDGFLEGRIFTTGKRPLRKSASPSLDDRPLSVLVVDDVVSVGTEMDRVRHRMERDSSQHSYCYLAVFGFPGRPGRADLILEEVPRPMVFEWSFLHSTALDRVCLDIDGIICVDPTSEEDDGGDGYRRFLAEARPLFLPTATARALVTSRPESARAATMAWLERHGVTYRELHMMPDLAPGVKRRQADVASFKASVYGETDAVLFVESNPGLADMIAQQAGKPVLALTNNSVKKPSLIVKARLRWQAALWRVRRLRRAPKKVLSLVRQGWGSDAQ